MTNNCGQCGHGREIKHETYTHIQCTISTPGGGYIWFDGCPYFTPKLMDLDLKNLLDTLNNDPENNLEIVVNGDE